MTLPRTVADVVLEHVTFEVECIDRMYLNVYVPQLQYEAGSSGYVHQQLGLLIASTAPAGEDHYAFRDEVRRFARELAGLAVASRAHRAQGEDRAVLHRRLGGGPVRVIMCDAAIVVILSIEFLGQYP